MNWLAYLALLWLAVVTVAVFTVPWWGPPIERHDVWGQLRDAWDTPPDIPTKPYDPRKEEDTP